jgi:hypothetical protein
MKNGYVLEHRYIMSEHLGRPLEPHGSFTTRIAIAKTTPSRILSWSPAMQSTIVYMA